MGLLDLLKGGGGGAGITSIDVATAHQRVQKKALTLIDVRTEEEWRSGVAHSAHTISLNDPSLANKVFELVDEATETPIAVICRSGMRSTQAAGILVRAGFTDVSNVKGGMMAWQSAGLPTTAYSE